MTRTEGFSLVEAVVALSLTLLVTTAALSLANPAAMMSQAQPSIVDTEQRLRVSIQTLTHDLTMAGAGMTVGAAAGSLIDAFAPILPRRLGAQSSDPATTARPDAITITYVPGATAQSWSTAPIVAGSPLLLNASPCAVGQTLCGFQAGMGAVMFDRMGAFDLVSVTQVQSTGASWQPRGPGSGLTYPAGTPVAEVQTRTYYFDAAAAQLRQYDGAQTDVPIADNVVGLTFEYFGDSQAPVRPRPPVGTANCLYEVDGTPKPLPVLSGTGSLVALPLSELSDGPWCGSGATQYDVDLLRIRMVRVAIRVQSAVAELRGTGAGYARPGTSRQSLRLAPDAMAIFAVSPENMKGGA